MKKRQEEEEEERRRSSRGIASLFWSRENGCYFRHIQEGLEKKKGEVQSTEK